MHSEAPHCPQALSPRLDHTPELPSKDTQSPRSPGGPCSQHHGWSQSLPPLPPALPKETPKERWGTWDNSSGHPRDAPVLVKGLHLILNVSSETRITTTDLSLSFPTLPCMEELLVCTIPKPRAWNHLPFLLLQALLNPSAPEQKACSRTP